MREIRASVTSKGQVTIPIEIRRVLGVSEGETVAFVVEDGKVHITRRGSVVEETAGALRTNQPPITVQEERAAAERAIADDVIERSG